MKDIKVCRICLIMDVKMYDLQTYPLITYFEQIMGMNPLRMIDLPSYACYECAALVRKFYLFRERCLRGEATLFNLLNTTGKITIHEVQQIDRGGLQLKSNLSICNILDDLSTSCIYGDSYKFEVKEEIGIENSQACSIDIDDIKQEDIYDDYQSLSALTSDDDEPLSFHKSIKDKKGKGEKKKERKGRKKRQLNNDVKMELTAEQLQGIEATEDVAALPPEITDIVKLKPKRGRPRKIDAERKVVKEPKVRRTRNTGGVAADGADLEDYVTIIKLSVDEQIDEIKKRQHSSNYKNAPFQCNLCFKGFIDTHAWKHHVGKHDPSAGDIECPICKFRFKTRRTLQKHAANHEKKYACKSCQYVSKTTTQAKQHQRWHKGVTYKCQYCDEVSTKWTSYLSHVRIKHPSEFICGVCGCSFVSKLGLTMHKTMMHKDIVEKTKAEGENKTEGAGLYCEQCDVQFLSAEAWKRHMVMSVKHTQSTDFNNGCRVCGETFKSGEELRLHHRKEHARKRPKNYGKKPSGAAWPAKCEHCSEEITNARQYWTHFRRAHPDKDYPIQKNHICDICGKCFRGNAFLVYHKRTHFEERAYKCGQCPKAFFNRTNLQMHEKTHSDHRPYPCTVCFKAFKCKGALDRHFRSHTGVKPYECEVCGKAFGQSNSRKLHVRTVHLRQPAPYVSRARLERRGKLAPHAPLAPHAAPREPPPHAFIY